MKVVWIMGSRVGGMGMELLLVNPVPQVVVILELQNVKQQELKHQFLVKYVRLHNQI